MAVYPTTTPCFKLVSPRILSSPLLSVGRTPRHGILRHRRANIPLPDTPRPYLQAPYPFIGMNYYLHSKELHANQSVGFVTTRLLLYHLFKFSVFHRSGAAGVSQATDNTLFNYHTHTFTSFGPADLTSPPPSPSPVLPRPRRRCTRRSTLPRVMRQADENVVGEDR